MIGVFKESLKLFRHNSIFITLMIVLNLLAMACVIGMGVIVYFFSRQNVISLVIESNLALTSQTQAEIEHELEALDRLTLQLALEANVKAATGNSLYTPHAINTNRYAIGNINSLKASNEQVQDIWVHLRKTRGVLTDSARYEEDFFFSDVMQYTGNPDFQAAFIQFPQLVYSGEHTIYSRGTQSRVMTFIRAIPLDGVNPTGVIGINIKRSRFQEVLDSLNNGTHSSFYILDQNGHPVITGSRSAFPGSSQTVIQDLWRALAQGESGYQVETIADKDYLVTYSFSGRYGWSYLAITPMDVISKSASPIKSVTVITAILCIALSLMLSFVIARRIYQPVLQLVNIVRSMVQEGGDTGVRHNEFDFIGAMLDYTFRKYNVLQESYRRNLPFLQDELLDGILSGKSSGDTIQSRCAELELDFPYPEFMAVTFLAGGTIYQHTHRADRVSKKMAEESIASSGAKYRMYFVYKNAMTWAAIFNMNPAPDVMQDIREGIWQIKRMLENILGHEVSVGIGESYGAITDLRLSFIDSLTALKYCELRGFGSMIHIDEVKDLPSRILTYSVETEIQLINCVKTGDFSGARRLVNEIFRCDSGEMTPELMQNLTYALSGTAVRTIYEIRFTVADVFPDIPDLYRYISGLPTAESRRDAIVEILHRIILFIDQSRQAQSSRLLEEVNKVLRNTDGAVTLAETADRVGLSYTYLSSIFKELAGESFVDYVNRYRIERGRELLDNTDHTVGQIAEMVGFISANTFIRVFKKFQGVTPGKYKARNME